MNNTELHPYLKEGKIEGATKLILGSFPVYACTNPDNPEKLKIRNMEGTVLFFYGSCRNRFWGLYHQYIDASVTVPVNKAMALKSFRKHNIAMSDIIESCTRKGTSALDSNLRGINYNTAMIQDFMQSGVTKILCTSKGVLALLDKHIIPKLTGAHFNETLTNEFTDKFLSVIGGDSKSSARPICRIYTYDGRNIISLAIPSPGSPQRQISAFGYRSGSKLAYADQYFKMAFNWIKNEEDVLFLR